ncbi:MAG: dihydrodipicolinate reductase, partial [Gammaproteobacteria bacterium]
MLPRVAVAGATGTISRLCVAAVMNAPSCALSGGLLRPGHAQAGQDVGDLAAC